MQNRAEHLSGPFPLGRVSETEGSNKTPYSFDLLEKSIKCLNYQYCVIL
ncbi:MAG: hypothetical protein A4E66_00194 [Syntrophus sp. PtaB.Bin001]|nr:MAG: hypothetical protein A4E66_00194 [Syntrophus sp. PtaB.Bin001]